MNSTSDHGLHSVKAVSAVCLVALLSLLPSIACAADGPETQLLPMGLKALAALVVVLGLVLLIYAWLKKNNRWIRTGKNSAIKLLEVRYLAPKKALYLVEVDGAKLLLSSTPGRLETLAQWQLPDSDVDMPVAASSHFDTELNQQLKEHGTHD